jgi:hypothetical protein
MEIDGPALARGQAGKNAVIRIGLPRVPSSQAASAGDVAAAGALRERLALGFGVSFAGTLGGREAPACCSMTSFGRKSAARTAPPVARSIATREARPGLRRPLIQPCTVGTFSPIEEAKAVRVMPFCFRYSASVMVAISRYAKFFVKRIFAVRG